MKVVTAIAAIVIAAVGIFELINAIVTWMGEMVGVESVTLEVLSTYMYQL